MSGKGRKGGKGPGKSGSNSAVSPVPPGLPVSGTVPKVESAAARRERTAIQKAMEKKAMENSLNNRGDNAGHGNGAGTNVQPAGGGGSGGGAGRDAVVNEPQNRVDDADGDDDKIDSGLSDGGSSDSAYEGEDDAMSTHIPFFERMGMKTAAINGKSVPSRPHKTSMRYDYVDFLAQNELDYGRGTALTFCMILAFESFKRKKSLKIAKVISMNPKVVDVDRTAASVLLPNRILIHQRCETDPGADKGLLLSTLRPGVGESFSKATIEEHNTCIDIITGHLEKCLQWAVDLLVSQQTKKLGNENLRNYFKMQDVSTLPPMIMRLLEYYASVTDDIKQVAPAAFKMMSNRTDFTRYHTAASSLGSLWKRFVDDGTCISVIESNDVRALDAVLASPEDLTLTRKVSDKAIVTLRAYFEANKQLPDNWYMAEHAKNRVPPTKYRTLVEVFKRIQELQSDTAFISDAKDIGALLEFAKNSVGIAMAQTV